MLTFSYQNSTVTFSSGAKTRCYGDSFNINASGWSRMYYGYDGAIRLHELSPADCVEAADHMIQRWTRFREHFARLAAGALIELQDCGPTRRVEIPPGCKVLEIPAFPKSGGARWYGPDQPIRLLEFNSVRCKATGELTEDLVPIWRPA